MAVFFKCSACGGEHKSMIQMPEQALANATIENNSQNCPKTGKSVTDDKAEMFWKQDPLPN